MRCTYYKQILGVGVTARDVCNTLLLLNTRVLIEPITSHRKREFLWTLEPARKEKVETLVATETMIRSLSLARLGWTAGAEDAKAHDAASATSVWPPAPSHSSHR